MPLSKLERSACLRRWPLPAVVVREVDRPATASHRGRGVRWGENAHMRTARIDALWEAHSRGSSVVSSWVFSRTQVRQRALLAKVARV